MFLLIRFTGKATEIKVRGTFIFKMKSLSFSVFFSPTKQKKKNHANYLDHSVMNESALYFSSSKQMEMLKSKDTF